MNVVVLCIANTEINDLVVQMNSLINTVPWRDTHKLPFLSFENSYIWGLSVVDLITSRPYLTVYMTKIFSSFIIWKMGGLHKVNYIL
jgi:hypothetical protein